MKIKIESLGLPLLSRLIGKKTEIDFPGKTVADLVAHLVKRHGQEMQKALLDKDGRLDLTIQVMMNDEGILHREQYPKRILKDGDKVIFMILVGGG
ncbi:MAG: MoaD/ThiS family protein [Thermodesulfobacteriota bacterium]